MDMCLQHRMQQAFSLRFTLLEDSFLDLSHVPRCDTILQIVLHHFLGAKDLVEKFAFSIRFMNWYSLFFSEIYTSFHAITFVQLRTACTSTF